MNAIAVKPIVSAVLISGLMATSASFAQSGATNPASSHGGQQFDSTTAHVAAGTRIDNRSSAVPGPYAQYLLKNGANREDALKAAGTADRPAQGATTVAIADAPATSEAGPYAKYLMHVGLSKRDAIAAASDVDLRQEAVSKGPIRSTRKHG